MKHAIAICLMCLPGFALADGPSDGALSPEPQEPHFWADAQPDLVFTLRGGVDVSPEYFGSGDYRVGPDFSFSLQYFSFGGRQIGSLDGGRDLGFSLAPSIRYIRGRSGLDYPELAGLDDVDPALELGFGARYAFENFEAFADVRRGFGGHEGFVGEIGADLLVFPTDRLTLSLGPRVALGDDSFSATYFGVTTGESLASGLTEFSPEGGVVSTGVELGVTYQVNDLWGVEGAVRYDRLQGDAATSPIVQDDEQLSVRVGITRTISLDF